MHTKRHAANLGPRAERRAPQEQVAALRRRFAELNPSLVSHYDAALQQIAPLVTQAHNLGHPPLFAEGLSTQGNLQLRAGQYDEAERSLRDAVRAAEQSGDDLMAARALVDLMAVSSYREHFLEGIERGKDAAAILARIGGNDSLAPVLDQRFGMLFHELSRYDEAEVALRRALAALQRSPRASGLEEARVLMVLGVVEAARGRFDEALAHQERALLIGTPDAGRGVPGDRPLSREPYRDLYRAGRYREALARGERALAIRATILRPDHPDVAESRWQVALLLVVQGQSNERSGWPGRRCGFTSKRRSLERRPTITRCWRRRCASSDGSASRSLPVDIERPRLSDR